MLIAASVAQAMSGPAVTGIVTDKTTGQPVAGAQVVVVWDGTNILGYFSNDGGCHYVQNAVTGKDGRFNLPAWDKSVPNHIVNDYRIGVYHTGYGVVEGESYGGSRFHAGQVAPIDNKLVLPPFAGTVKQRLQALQRMRNYIRCPEAGASRGNFIDFYREMNDEIKQLVATEEGEELRQQERAEIQRRGKLGMDTLGYPRIAYDLDGAIEGLKQSHDGELYEPVRKP